MEQGIAARVADRAPAGVLEPAAPLTPVPPPRRRPVARDRWLALVSLGAALVPAVVAAVRAATGGWVPVGESALIAVRSGDVLRGASGGGVPMVGPWADTSGPLGFDVFHPGPLLYDVLAVPVQLAGAEGLAMAVAAVNAVAIVGIFLVVRRVAGETMAALAMALVAVLCWVTGTAALIEPGYPGTVVLPFLWFLVLVWGATCGRVWCLPVAVVVGGFVGGTDLRVTLFVPVLLVVAGVSVARSAWGLPVRRWSRPAGALAVAGLLAVGCLVQPVLEELQGEGGGNLVHLWEGAAEHTTTLDVGTSARVLARVVALPPWWVRPWHADDFGVGPGGTVGPPLALAVVALVGLTFQGVVRLRDARRRGDRATSSGIALAFLATGLAFVTIELLPTTPFGTAVPQLRWTWAVAVFVSLVLFLSGYRQLKPAQGDRWWPAALSAGAAVLVAVAVLPAADRGGVATARVRRAAEDVTGQLAAADLDGPLLVECDETMLDPYCEAVMAELAGDGVTFVVDDPATASQVGQRRRAGRDPDVAGTLTVAVGDGVLAAPRRATTVAGHRALSNAEADELEDLRNALIQALENGDVRLNDRGEEVAREGLLSSVDPDDTALRIDPEAALAVRGELFGAHRRDLVAMVDHGLVESVAPWRGALDRYRDLQDRWDEATVTVYLES